METMSVTVTKFRWMVHRNEQRVYCAVVFVRREAERFEVTVSKELSSRPTSKDEAKRLCDELVPDLLKRLRQCEAGGTKLRDRTDSEILFEQFCGIHGIPYARVNESSERTPDYEIEVSGQRVVVEVKETEDEWPEPGEIRVRRVSIGKRLRKLIDSGYKQIKNRTASKLPGMLLVYDSTLSHVGPESVRAAMFGDYQVVASVPYDRSKSPKLIDRKRGGGRKTTPVAGRALSAIAVLSQPSRIASLMVV
jgi:hypothetical protein